MPPTTTKPPAVPASTDPLGAALHLLRLTGTLYCRSELSAPWGIELPALEGCMMLHVITAGSAWLEVEGEEPRLLRKGSLVLIPHGRGHALCSAPDVATEALFDLPVEKVSERYEILRHGGGGEPTGAICVVVRFDHVAAERLVALLPSVLLVDAWDEESSRYLHSTLRFLALEAQQLRPGGETVITRLADILVVQMIRAWIDSAPEAASGWLGALRDDAIGRALAAIHREPARAWTLASLAAEVSMSRSAFSTRFTELVGEPAMHYLTDWRMQLARTWLRDTNEPLATLAARVGYQSEAAFCRAFKRVIGVSPGSVRRGG